MFKNPKLLQRQDGLFVVVLTLFSAASYVFELGFYSDDWHFLQAFQFAEDQTWPGYFSAIFEPHTRGRPLQIAYQSMLYALMSSNGALIHLTNTLVLGAGAGFLYFLLREVVGRQPSLCVACIYATMPHYTTNCFWFASNQVTLAAMLCFLSGWLFFRHHQRASVQGTQSGSLWLLFLATVAMILSSLAYETHLPLFFVFAVGAIWKHRRTDQLPDQSQDRRGRLIPVGTILYLVALVITYAWKQSVSSRAVRIDSLIDRSVWFARNMALTQIKDYVDLGVALPFLMARKAAQGEIDLVNFAVAAGAAVACYLYFSLTGHLFQATKRKAGLKLIGFGLALALFARIVFFFSYGWIVSSLANSNRVDMASAVGVAFVFAGGLLCATTLFTERWPNTGALLVSSLVFVQLLCVGLAGDAWSKSKDIQTQILSDLRADIPDLSSGSTLILDACRAVGPATIFETPWGITGALRVAYNNPDLQANVLSEDWRATADHLEISTYRQQRSYPYSPVTWIYQWPARNLIVMDHEKALQNIEHNRSDCSPARAGHGSPTLRGILDALLRYKFRTSKLEPFLWRDQPATRTKFEASPAPPPPTPLEALSMTVPMIWQLRAALPMKKP